MGIVLSQVYLSSDNLDHIWIHERIGLDFKQHGTSEPRIDVSTSTGSIDQRRYSIFHSDNLSRTQQ